MKLPKFVGDVMALFEGSDEGKVLKFQKQALKEAKKQIKIRKDKIVEIKELREEYVTEAGPEKMHRLSMDAIGTIEDRREYIKSTFFPTMFKVLDETADFDKKIEVKEKEIAKFEEIVTRLA
jgi:hypothetical protein